MGIVARFLVAAGMIALLICWTLETAEAFGADLFVENHTHAATVSAECRRARRICISHALDHRRAGRRPTFGDRGARLDRGCEGKGWGRLNRPMTGIPGGLRFRSWLAPRRNARVWTVVLAYLLPVWVFRYVPTQDGPSHVFNALVIKDYSDSAAGYHQVFEIRADPLPNWTSHLLLAGLLYVVPPLVAEKLLVSLYVLGFAGSFRYFLGAFGERPPPDLVGGAALRLQPLLLDGLLQLLPGSRIAVDDSRVLPCAAARRCTCRKQPY